MFFDFCVGSPGVAGEPFGLDTIYSVWGDATYQTPRKAITPGKTYLAFTTRGQGRIRYDGHTFDVQAGDCIVMRPTRDFGYGCHEHEWHFWWFELVSPQHYLPVNTVLKDLQGDFACSLFRHSLFYAKQARWDIAQSLLASAMLIFAHQRSQTAHAPIDNRLAEAEAYIRANLADVNVGTLCDHLSLKERTLRNLCHQAFGESPKQIISRIRFETAQQLLVNTAMSLGQISAYLGFSSQFHFSRSFRVQYGSTPSDYRRRFVL
jgi:AraC-like DNA-binding protein